jgi:urea transport system substrate-binding protein
MTDSDRPISIGILHSTTGTMSLNETSLRDVILMEVARVNAEGGLLGRQIEPVAIDPASDWASYRDIARAMIDHHHVVAIFGCWTSASRKAVLPIVEQADNLLFYPLQYEGEEQSRNVFYLGTTPNQQALPALDYLMSAPGGAFNRFFFIGTDYVYPRTTNRILQAFLKAKGVSTEPFPEHYVPFGHNDWSAEIGALARFRREGRCAIVSTINGDSNLSFYRAVKAANFHAEDLPIMAFSVSETELRSLDPDDVAGHYACWNYFMSDPAPENQSFLAAWRRFVRDGRPVYAPMAAAVLGFRLWCKAVVAAGTTATANVRQYMLGQSEVALTGDTAVMGVNQHVDAAVSIGRATRHRQFEIIWRAARPIPGDPWAANAIIDDATATNIQREVLDALPTPLIVLDADGHVRYRSTSTNDYFGPEIKPGQLKKLRDIIGKFDAARSSSRGGTLPALTVRDASGRIRHLTTSVGRMVFAGRSAHLLSFADVTHIRKIEEELRVLNVESKRLATTDALTGIKNRRYFMNTVTTHLMQMRLHGRPAAIFMLDLDHFKSLNDRHGHEFGDKALIKVATAAHRLMRRGDIFARIGGEEFAGFLPDTDLEGALATADRLRACVADLHLAVGDDSVALTCSIGIAAVDPRADTLESAMKRADDGLYTAKRDGRNVIRCMGARPCLTSAPASGRR